jgi:hypothetical protein
MVAACHLLAQLATPYLHPSQNQLCCCSHLENFDHYRQWVFRSQAPAKRNGRAAKGTN